MSSKEFLAYIREHVGNYCSDRYWLLVYYHLESIDPEYIKKLTPFLGIGAIRRHHASKTI